MPHGGRWPNKFGFDSTKSAREQLQSVLHLENEEVFGEIVLTIKRLTRKELDIDKQGGAQIRETSAIKQKIAEQYPHIFGAVVRDGEKRLYFAYKYILDIHAIDRRKSKEKRKKAKELRRKNDNIRKRPKLNTRSSVSRNGVPQSSDEEESNDIEIASSNRKTRSGSFKGTKWNEENIPPSGSIAGSTTRTSQLSQISAATSQASSSRTVFQSSQPFPNQTRQSSNQATIGPIYEFLDTCLPSMTHHLQSFLDFGCKTPEHLFSMSLWQPGIIHEFLEKLPPNMHGEHLTEMEKLIIQNHLLTYFKSS